MHPCPLHCSLRRRPGEARAARRVPRVAQVHALYGRDPRLSSVARPCRACRRGRPCAWPVAFVALAPSPLGLRPGCRHAHQPSSRTAVRRDPAEGRGRQRSTALLCRASALTLSCPCASASADSETLQSPARPATVSQLCNRPCNRLAVVQRAAQKSRSHAGPASLAVPASLAGTASLAGLRDWCDLRVL
jgi:hypothetical protein